MTELGLREARRKLGLNQTKMGKRLGMSREAISFMERGERPIELRTELAVRYRLVEAGIYTMADFST